MRHRNLAAAGRDLAITGSAVSHAVARLRAVLDDDLFVAGVNGMVPTARAIELAPKVGAALATLGDVLASKPFRPATAERVFRIGASDHTGAIFLPGLVDHLLQHAPGVRLRILPIGRTDLVEQLDEGRLDVVVTWFGPTPGRIRRKDLFKEREALVVRPGHPLAGSKPDKAALLAYPHLVVELVGGSETAPGGFYEERGFHRRVWAERLLLENALHEKAERMAVVTVPSFGLVAPLLSAATTDLVATLPLRLARRIAASHELVMLETPFEPYEITNEIAWHERGDRDPALLWLIDRIEAICAALEPLSPLSPDSQPQ